MRTLSVLDKYRANVLGPCRARVITLFTVFPWRVTIDVICSYTLLWPYMETASVILKQNFINVGFNSQLLLKDLENGKILHTSCLSLLLSMKYH